MAPHDRSAPHDRVAQQLVLRPRKMFVLAWVSAVILAVGFTVMGVLLRNTDTGVYFTVADQVSMVVMGLLLAGAALLLAQPRVRADATGIEVRNVISSRRLEWVDVIRIAFPDGASWARLDLPDDEYLPVLAIQAVDRTHAVAGIRKLRALHAAARTDQ